MMGEGCLGSPRFCQDERRLRGYLCGRLPTEPQRLEAK